MSVKQLVAGTQNPNNSSSRFGHPVNKFLKTGISTNCMISLSRCILQREQF